MSTEARCPRCGTELQNPGSAQELCPECFLKLGLSGAIDAPPPEVGADPPEDAQKPAPEILKQLPVRRERRIPWRRVGAISLLVLVALAIFSLVRIAFRPAPPLNEVRLTIVTPETADPFSVAVSPDGREVLFAAMSEGHSQLWLRRMDSIEPQPLPGTENGFYPFWSPDSTSIGFFANGKLKRMAVSGGPAQTLANAPLGCGGTWNADRMILFAPSCNGPLLRVSAIGGDSEMVLPGTAIPDEGALGLRFPQFLPDGQHFLFYVAREQNSGVAVGDLFSGRTDLLLQTDSAAVYSSSGHLLFAREGTLLAQPFDVTRLEVDGTTSAVVGQVAVDATTAAAAVSASNGTIVYRNGSSRAPGRLVWFDRSGRATGMLDPEIDGEWPALSPDGRNVALQRTVNGNTDIWLFDIARPLLRRLTFGPAVDSAPLWSPDGTRIVFRSNRSGSSGLYQKLFSGAGQEDPLPIDLQNGFATDWSADGKFLLYQSANLNTGWDVSVVPMNGDHRSMPVLHTDFDELGAQFSPDSRWIAYQSNESGRFEIYLQSFPEPTQKFQVTTTGGTQAAWRRDGRELFFVSANGSIMGITIQANVNTPGVDLGVPYELVFLGAAAGAQRNYLRQYAVSPGGERLLMNLQGEEASSQLTVILNWQNRPSDRR